MGHHIIGLVRDALVHYGYWAIAAALLLENIGLPLPGETALLLASFLAYSQRELQIGWIIVVGTVTATAGSCLGYAIGFYGGRPLLEHYPYFLHVNDGTLMRGEKLFVRYGPITILCARFIFGLRVIVGPLAGVLRMPWKTFAIFNFLGVALWVTVISFVGYGFGRHWQRLMHFMKRFDLALVASFVVVLALLWWRSRQKNRLRISE
jgi:membrane-associated protein